MISYLANPHRFMRVSIWLAPVLYTLAVLMIGFSVWQGLYIVPPADLHGDGARILMVHVPTAWLALSSYTVLAIASFTWYIWRHELADIAAKTIAPLGAAYTALCLATGSLWGKPAWGTWWEWGDPRMVFTLILLFQFIGYIALRAAMDTRQKAARAGAILAMAGIITVPLTKFSVDWFASLHQEASLVRADGPAMSAEYFVPLIIGIFGHMLLFGALTLTAMRTEIVARQVARQRATLLAGA